MFKVLRTITRLAIGGVSTGLDVFTTKLQEWEEVEPDFDNNSLVGNSFVDEKQAGIIPLAAIGLVFKAQERLEARIGLVKKGFDRVGRAAVPVAKTIQNSSLLSPIGRRFSNLVDHGEDKVNQWVVKGRYEVDQSRQVAQKAFYETIDFWIQYFAKNQEVVDLVTSQSVSFAEEVVEEVRERTVSVDNYLDDLFRHFLRRKSRHELPGPPPSIKAKAVSTRQGKKRYPM